VENGSGHGYLHEPASEAQGGGGGEGGGAEHLGVSAYD
jgi:hypothetical protein